MPTNKEKLVTNIKNTWYTRRKVSKKFEYYKNHKNSINFKQYSVIQRRYNKECKQTKNQAERDFISEIDSISDTSKYYKHLNIPEIPLGVLTDNDGMETRPGEDTIKHLYEIHFPQHTIIRDAIYDTEAKILKSELDDKLKKILTTEKVRRALKGFDNKKSPGPDNFKPIMFKYCLLYTSPSPRDKRQSRMPSSA